MVVRESDRKGNAGVYVLKLYDHRFADGLRSEYNMNAFSEDDAKAYQEYVDMQNGTEFIQELLEHDKQGTEPDDTQWTTAENELFLRKLCLGMRSAEFAAYDRLKDLQGSCVPTLHAAVRLEWLHELDSAKQKAAESSFYNTEGVVLEYLHGFDMADLSLNGPTSEYQPICDEALRIVDMCSDRHVLNKDVRPENFIVETSTRNDHSGLQAENSNHEYLVGRRVVMIDFAQCCLRASNESDQQWGRRKWQQDERGAIGMVMRHRLKTLEGFDLEYKPSERYLQWAPGEDD